LLFLNTFCNLTGNENIMGYYETGTDCDAGFGVAGLLHEGGTE
jgi:hypothetical protein